MADTVLFTFPDLPTDTMGWSMYTAGFVDNVGRGGLDDRSVKTLYSRSLSEGASGTIDFVDHIFYDTESPNFEIFDRWPAEIDQVKAAYAAILDGTFNCQISSLQESQALETISFKLYPYPACSVVAVKFVEKFSGSLRLHDNLGRLVISEELAQVINLELNLNPLINGINIIELMDES